VGEESRSGCSFTPPTLPGDHRTPEQATCRRSRSAGQAAKAATPAHGARKAPPTAGASGLGMHRARRRAGESVTPRYGTADCERGSSGPDSLPLIPCAAAIAVVASWVGRWLRLSIDLF